MATSKKKFDCIEFKRKSQTKNYNKLKNIPPAEQVDFFSPEFFVRPFGCMVGVCNRV